MWKKLVLLLHLHRASDIFFWVFHKSFLFFLQTASSSSSVNFWTTVSSGGVLLLLFNLFWRVPLSVSLILLHLTVRRFLCSSPCWCSRGRLSTTSSVRRRPKISSTEKFAWDGGFDNIYCGRPLCRAWVFHKSFLFFLQTLRTSWASLKNCSRTSRGEDGFFVFFS